MMRLRARSMEEVIQCLHIHAADSGCRVLFAIVAQWPTAAEFFRQVALSEHEHSSQTHSVH